MDIFILSNDEEIGPFNEQTAQTLIAEGTVADTALAWHSGVDDWTPLCKILPVETVPESSRAGSVAPPAETSAAHPATDKQKAFLSFLEIEHAHNVSAERAAGLLNEARKDPARASRIGQWSGERLKLHPELFDAEVQAKKEHRASHYFEICQAEGAQFFTRVTKAHCQVAASLLDAKFPGWDEGGEDTASKYFFPAIAQKFPQLVELQWRGQFQFGSELKASQKTGSRKWRQVSAWEAMARGLVLGAAVLAILYFGYWMSSRWRNHHPGTNATVNAAGAAPVQIVAGRSQKEPGIAPSDEAIKKDAGGRKQQGASPQAGVAPAEAAAKQTNAAPAMSKPAEAAMDSVPSAAPSQSSPAPAAPPQALPADAAAVKPPAAPADTEPANPPPPPLPAPEVALSKGQLTLTKPVTLQLVYGQVKLPAGTPLKLISRDGALLKVNYSDTVIEVPASSTDIDSSAAPPAASPGPAAVPPVKSPAGN